MAGGFQVGVHGLSPRWTRTWNPKRIFLRAASWYARGGRQDGTPSASRSPATHRDRDACPASGSITTRRTRTPIRSSHRAEAVARGCRSLSKIWSSCRSTMPQDHTLFEILRQPDERAWVQKASFLRAQGGLALLDTHPDYLADQQIMAAYERFLERFAHDDRAWRALPAEVSAWWRRRSQSYLQRDGKGWAVVGAATTDARVEFFPTDAHALIASPVGRSASHDAPARAQEPLVAESLPANRSGGSRGRTPNGARQA